MNHQSNINSENIISVDNTYTRPDNRNIKKSALAFFKRFGVYLLLTLAAISAIITLFIQEPILNEKAKRNEELASQLKQVESQEKELENERDYAGTEDYAQDAARDKLGWVKDDELVFKEGAANSSATGE